MDYSARPPSTDVQNTDKLEFDVPTYREFCNQAEVQVQMTKEEYDVAIDVLAREVADAIKFGEGNTRDLGGGLIGLHIPNSTAYSRIIRMELENEFDDLAADEIDVEELYPALISCESQRGMTESVPGHISVIAVHRGGSQ